MDTSYYKLKIEKRKSVGKKSSKKTRRDGKTPSILYFKGEPPINLEIENGILHKALKSDQRIYEIDIDDKTQYVMIKEAQYHPVTDQIIHVDFMRVRRSEKMTISVPVTLIGKPIGVTEGGILSQALNQIEIRCYPTNVPEQIEVDIENLELNSSISVADIEIDDEDIEIITASELNVTSIIPPAAEEEVAIEDEDEEDSDEKISGEQPAEGDEEKPKEDKENQSESKDDSSEDSK